MPASEAAHATDRETLLDRAARVIPNGASSGGRALFEDLIVKAAGAHVWNADGVRFVDHLLAFGPIVLGHCDPHVNAAVTEAASVCDLNWVGPQAGEIELAEMICADMPSADKVAFCTSGSDATLHAVHLVRAATGRTRLLKFYGSYHGWHDHVAVGARFRRGTGGRLSMTEPNAAGLLPSVLAEVSVVEWNDLAAVQQVFEDEGDELAGVFAEPYVHSYGCVGPAPGFLEGVRALCDRHGTALVFDEIKTGFRHHVGGFQSVCSVLPDLTTFGKALGNGYSIAGIGGRASIMDLLGSASDTNVTLEGTYNASPYALAAGAATLERLRAGGIAQLYELGEKLRAGLAETFARSDLPVCVTGFGSEWAVYFRRDPPTNYSEALESDSDLAERFRQEMLRAGILEPPFPMSDRRICVAMSEDDVDLTIDAAEKAVNALARDG